MAHLLRVVPRTTSLLTPLVRPCVSVSFFHSPACSSLSFSANYPQITPSQITKEIIHAPLFNEGVIQFGKYDAGDDPDGDKLSKNERLKDEREERKKQKKAEAPKKERKKERRGDQR